jgi:hypothetical protein
VADRRGRLYSELRPGRRQPLLAVLPESGGPFRHRRQLDSSLDDRRIRTVRPGRDRGIVKT